MDRRGSGRPVELLGVRLPPGAAGIWEAAGAGADRQGQWVSGELQGPGQAGRALHTSQEGRWQKSKRTSFVPVSSPGRTGGPVTAGNHRTFLL